jgi:hypothetical protein
MLKPPKKMAFFWAPRLLLGDLVQSIVDMSPCLGLQNMYLVTCKVLSKTRKIG